MYNKLTLHGNTFSKAQLLLLCAGTKALPLSEFEKDCFEFIAWFIDEKSTSIEQKTSGSTGTPKAITLYKKHMIASAKQTINVLKLSSGNSALLCMSTKYIAGKMMIVRAFVGRLNLMITEPNNAPLKDVDGSIDFAAMIPSQVHDSLKNQHHKLKNVKKLIIGGGAVNHKTRKELMALPGKIYNTYGMTETCTHIALQDLKQSNAAFEALPNVQIGIDNRNCLVISAKELGCDELVTNDIVELINTETFKWIGRFDNVINSGGIKIFPGQLERTLAREISRPFFIAALPHPKWGEQVVLYIEGKPYKLELNNIESKMLPKETIFVKQFVYTESGKINRIETQNLVNSTL